MIQNEVAWVSDIFYISFQPKEHVTIDKWIDDGNLSIPSNNPEPGIYSLDRTPYQREVLKRLSPQDPTKEVILCFGSQLGKTTMEMAIMCYYIASEPAPMGFAFSDDKNLKNFVKNKFDPFKAANSNINNLLRSDGSSKADTQSSKLYPGGYLKLFSGKSESSMRSDTFKVVIGDEIDAAGQTKGGDIKDMLKARVSVYGDTGKMCLSSTPLNTSHMIWDYLQASTFNKFYVKCPHCGEEMTFEFEYLKYDVEKKSVTKAWMECPHCKGKIYNENKVTMLKTGVWKPTNPEANPLCQGYFLPTFYAPVGWVSWQELAQQYHDAAFNKGSIDIESMTTFYNTRLAKPFELSAVSSIAQKLFEENKESPYRRGEIPSWVNYITTGADVQKNRIEVKIIGWGKRNRNLTIDVKILYVPSDETIDMLDGKIWQEYTDNILNAEYLREDGYPLYSIANAIDSSYQTETLYGFWQSLQTDLRNRFFLVKGSDRLTGCVPVKHFVKKENYNDVEWYEIASSELKHYVFNYLAQEDDELHQKANINLFPNNFDLEFYEQIYSEQYIKKNSRTYKWEKIRARNEGLDTLVYNYGMYFWKGLNNLTDDLWDDVAETQRSYLENLSKPIVVTPKKRKSRVMSKGISL